MPTTFVHDLIIHPRDDVLVIATHGRGMYALDARPIQKYGVDSDEEDEPSEKAQEEGEREEISEEDDN